jgi:class 3 adenylate cyclase
MRCSKCGAENPDRARFCVECASPFPRRCPSCGTENPPTAKFCLECAKPLVNAVSEAQRPVQSANWTVQVSEQPTETTLDGERKTVTALFADIKGSMELMEELDPEEARSIVDPALRLMIDAVHRYGGYVAQSTGDGIFALFGAPIALQPRLGVRMRGRDDPDVPVRNYGSDRPARSGGLRADPNRIGADADTLDQHSGDQHFG